jgi:hypothetical protein
MADDRPAGKIYDGGRRRVIARIGHYHGKGAVAFGERQNPVEFEETRIDAIAIESLAREFGVTHERHTVEGGKFCREGIFLNKTETGQECDERIAGLQRSLPCTLKCGFRQLPGDDEMLWKSRIVCT